LPFSEHLLIFRRPKTASTGLVMTAGVLITSIGLSLLVAAYNRRAKAETIVLAMAAAVGLTAIDVIDVYRGVIDRIYLLDAAIEVVLLLAWAAVLSQNASRQSLSE